MTASKTQAVNKKMLKVTQDAIEFGSCPVYGPFIREQQLILAEEIEDAFRSYDYKLLHKYNTDPKFKGYADKFRGLAYELGDELQNENGWTFEDNDRSLETARSQWKNV